MLLNSKIDECFHIYKWSFSGGPTTINFPIPKWTFFRRMYSPFRTEIKDPGLDSSQKHQLSLHLQRAFFGYFFGIYILMLKVEYVFPSNNILSSLLCESLIWDGVGSPTLPPPDSPPRHWSAVVSGQWQAGLWLVESPHFRSSDWCGQWSHWSGLTTRRSPLVSGDHRDGQTCPPTTFPNPPPRPTLLLPPPPLPPPLLPLSSFFLQPI